MEESDVDGLVSPIIALEFIFAVKWLWIGVAVRPPLTFRDWLTKYDDIGDGTKRG